MKTKLISATKTGTKKINISIICAICVVSIISAFSFVSPIESLNINMDKGVKLPVLAYHNLSINKNNKSIYVISPEQFEQDLLHLKKSGYETISPTQLYNYVQKSEKLPKKPIMITFDDGYEGVFAYAFPLLKKYKMKAVFLPIGKKADIFSKPNAEKNIDNSHASWKQIREMQESSFVEIGNHTYNMHTKIKGQRKGTRIKPNESLKNYKKVLREDVFNYQKEILKETGKEPIIFAYPFGDECPESNKILKEFGFKIILNSHESVNHIVRKKHSTIHLNRYSRACRYSTTEFFKRIPK